MKFSEDERDEVAEALRLEVEERNEWYGLDNWGWREVVDFVADSLEREE